MNTSRGFLLVLIALLTVLSWLLVSPFLQYVLIALLLAYVLQPLQRRLEPRLGRSVAAGVLVVSATVLVLLPFVFLFAFIASDLRDIAAGLDPEALALSRLEGVIASRTGVEVDIAERASAVAERVAEFIVGSAPDVLGALVHVLIGIGVAVFLLYYLLKRGDRLVAWLREVSPLPDQVQEEFLAELDQMVWAVLAGHVLVALVQGTVAGLGLYVTGVPNALFWTVAMIVLGVVPVVGSFLVWAPAALWLGLSGSAVAGATLFGYGVIVVGISDDFIRPLIVGRAAVEPSIVILGVVGGLYVFGFMGLFVGPIIVGSLKVVLELYSEYYAEM